MQSPSNLILELAFIAQDPVGEHALALARAVLRLIYDRDDSDCVALTSELQALLLKYPPHTQGQQLMTITATCRNNVDAHRLCAGQISVPGATQVKHIQAGTVEIETRDEPATLAWLIASDEITSYMTVTDAAC